MTHVGSQRYSKKKKSTWKSERLYNEMGLYTECSRIRFADSTLTLQGNISLFTTNNQLKVTMKSFKIVSNCGPSC